MRVTLTTDYTTTDLVPLADAKETLRISATYDDDNVTALLEASRSAVERDTNRSILNQTWTMYLDAFPNTDVIILPKGKIQSVTSISYVDANGDDQDYTAFTASTGVDDGRIVPNTSWPSDVNTVRKNVVTIVYVAGYGSAKSSETGWAEAAIRVKLNQLYYNLEKSDAYNHLISLYRHHSLAYYENDN